MTFDARLKRHAVVVVVIVEENGETEMLTNPADRRLGPWPRLSLAILVDLGMTDVEIGRYLAVDAKSIAALRTSYRIMPSIRQP